MQTDLLSHPHQAFKWARILYELGETKQVLYYCIVFDRATQVRRSVPVITQETWNSVVSFSSLMSLRALSIWKLKASRRGRLAVPPKILACLLRRRVYTGKTKGECPA